MAFCDGEVVVMLEKIWTMQGRNSETGGLIQSVLLDFWARGAGRKDRL